MTSSSPRPRTKPSRLSPRRPRLEPLEDRVVLTASPHQAAVTQLYQDLLHRLPDSGGLDYWTNQLDQGAATQSVASSLTHSTEFHRAEVDGVYQRLLHRAADDGGRAFFASALDGGQTLQRVEAAVAASPEYAQSHPGASGFLDALFNGPDHLRTLVSGAYQQVLHRAADAAGLDYWAGRMSAGTSLDDVTASLAASAEKTGHAALGAGASGSGTGAAPRGVSPQAVTLKNGLPAVFQAFGPERLVDTRNPTAGQYGGPAFAAGETRTINVAPYNLADPSIPSAAIGDQPPTSNLPNKVVAVSVILFIVGAPTPEYFTAFATGTVPAPIGTASVFADTPGQIIAASALVPVNASGNIDVYSSGGGNLIIDVNGYFLDQLDGSDNLPISGSVPGGAGTSGVVVGTNASTTNFANGVTGTISTTTGGIYSAGVRGINNSTGGNGIGVYGSAAGAGPGGFFTAGTGGTGVNGLASGAGSSGGNFSGETGVSGTSSSTAGSATAIVGTISSTAPGGTSAGVRGINNSTTGSGYGVYGSQAGSGVGVYGTAGNGGIGGAFNAGTGGTAVQGFAFDASSIGGAFSANTGVSASGNTTGVSAYGNVTGVLGFTQGGTGVLGQVVANGVAGSAGVRGTNASVFGGVFGVLGEITANPAGGSSAAVRGINAGAGAGGIGVWGSQAGSGYGVYGVTTGAGFGVLGQASGGGSYGVLALGNLGASGVKSFVDPSPSDPSKQIAFVALEGNEVGTYFRGTGHFVNGTATLDVPQAFRDVTDPGDLTVQITPEGPTFTSVSIKSKDLNHVVVLGSQDVAFDYTVNGIRKGYQGYDPIQPNRVYVPQSATDTLPSWLTETQKQTLIADGTYHADGTVNLTTAHALGWDLLWSTNHATASAS